MKKAVGLFLLLWLPFCLVFIQHNTRGYDQQIVEVTQVKTINENQQKLTVKGLNQSLKAKTVTFTHHYTASLADSEAYKKGDILFVGKKRDSYEVTGVKRDGYFFLIAGLLAAVVLFVSGKKGIRILISVLLNLVLLYVFLSVYTSVKISIILTMGIFSIAATFLTLLLLDGWNRTSLLKIISTLLSTGLAFLICWLAMLITGDKGVRYEEMQFLTRPYRAVFLASMIVGTLGAAMDTVVTVIATMDELKEQHPESTIKELAASGRNVGRDVMGSMTNVLLFAYLSGGIPAVLLYLKNQWPFMETFNMHLSLEILRALCGALGIILTIPISIALYSWRASR